MENSKALLTLALLMTCYLIWEAWQVDYGVQDLVEQNVANTATPTMHNEGQPQALENQTTIPAINTSEDKIIKVITDVFALEINSKGGTIQNLDLLQYPVDKTNTAVDWLFGLFGWATLDRDLQPIRLFNTAEDKLFLAQSGWLGVGGSAGPDHLATFTYNRNQYELETGGETLEVPLDWVGADGILMRRTYVFSRGSYAITVMDKVVNDGSRPWSARQYNQLLRVPYQDEKDNTFIRTYAGGVVYSDEDKYQKIDYEDMGTTEKIETLGGWSAMVQHYFASAWVPEQSLRNHFYSKKLGGNRYVVGSYSPVFAVAPQGSVVVARQLFAGPKVQPAMEAIAQGLELTVDYGWLTIVGKPIYWLLNKIHGYIGNWGLSILGVTLCIKLLFFPLSQASFRSMAKMRKIQPRLKELKDKFADDKQRFNTEMMAMYKREEVNPLGGCLPILVQIPVFIALYWVLIETVELRQAELLWWIQDLSVRDPFFVLPIIMGATMKLQQSLNPAPIDPLQAKVMKMFPIVFTVFFLFFPAGLVFYWVCNNTLSFMQQWYITRQIEASNNDISEKSS